MRNLIIPKKYRHKIKSSALDISRNTNKKYQSFANGDALLPLIIGPKSDKIFQRMYDDFKHRAHFLALEDFGTLWRLDFDKIVINGQSISVSGIYYRSAEVTPDYEHHIELEIFEEQLPWLCSRVLGSPHYAIHNFSKAHQFSQIIARAQKGLDRIYLPRTLVVKDELLDLKKIRGHIGEGILKGLSCLRTQVIEEKTYKRLPLGLHSQTPTFFQEKLVGDEIRVHVIDGKLFPLLIQKKPSTLDYRYSEDCIYTEKVTLSEQERVFCERLVLAENNPLVGIDLIRGVRGTSCFEVNPNPGWACFAYEERTLKEMSLSIYSYLNGGQHVS